MKKYKCNLCPKKYQSQNDLDDHKQRIHGLSVAQIKEYSKEEQTEFMKQCAEFLERGKQ